MVSVTEQAPAAGNLQYTACEEPSVWAAVQREEEITIEALVLFPHQLFASNVQLAKQRTVFLIEDALFFLEYRFHKQKLILHRAAMRAHAAFLRSRAARLLYLDASQAPSMDAVMAKVAESSRRVHYIDPVDDWLHRRLKRAAASHGCELVRHATDMFLSDEELLRHHLSRHRTSMASFYAAQRKHLGILVEDGRPVGGRWSFDSANRERLPAHIDLPRLSVPADNEFTKEAREYVAARFNQNPGRVAGIYPVTHEDARAWLADFLTHRLERFGAYEDAISVNERVLFHSVLTPLLNIGLLTPREVVEAVLAHADRHPVPLNSLEGFVRQIIGWREYVRGAYEFHGRFQRTRNFWDHRRPLPPSFWTGRTGIEPIDTVIARVLESGYTHHIERLMILSNFMLLCEFSPDDCYRWFMEMFVDAYDWVMVPNVYGMGLHADGGRMMTKPYISGSSYILRMSNFKRGPWCEVWDGLFWRFVAKHRSFFEANPRLKVMARNLDRMGTDKLGKLIERADLWLAHCHAATTPDFALPRLARPQ